MENQISDIELLRSFINDYGYRKKVEENNLTDFESGDKIYCWTNESLKNYYNKDILGKKALAVTSSGDHMLHAILGGASSVTAFDINRFCKYYAAFKVAMIKTYGYNEFLEAFENKKDESFIYSSEITYKLLNIYKDVSLYLTKEEKEFWEEYIKLYEQKNVSIFNLLHKENFLSNAYCKKEEYEILKKRIFDCDIKYIDSNINKLGYKTTEKFDLIYISNIIGRIISYDMKTIFKVIKDLGKILNKDGTIYDYNMYGDLWRESYFPNLTDNDFNKILSEELPNYSIERDEISNGSGSVVYKFQLK